MDVTVTVAGLVLDRALADGWDGWDYHILSPVSLDDLAQVLVQFVNEDGRRWTYTLPLSA